MSTSMNILIITISQDEQSTEVMEWLYSFGAICTRINTDIKEENPLLSLTTINFDEKNQKEFDAVWVRKPRRQKTELFLQEPKTVKGYQKFIPAKAKRHLEKELADLQEYILSGIGVKKILGDFNQSELNKYVVLKKAKNIGLLIPPTILTTNREDLVSFKNRHGEIIGKMNHLLAGLNDDQSNMIHSYTEMISDELIEALPANFFPSVFQKKINKRFEIRSFYLDGCFYSIALFTQDNIQSSVDSRRYDFQNPVRNVPYKLPLHIEDTLSLLLKSLGLNTGSIDLIKDDTGMLYFLEINPVGQFGHTSEIGNYNLPRIVAEYLISKNDDNEE